MAISSSLLVSVKSAVISASVSSKGEFDSIAKFCFLHFCLSDASSASCSCAGTVSDVAIFGGIGDAGGWGDIGEVGSLSRKLPLTVSMLYLHKFIMMS